MLDLHNSQPTKPTHTLRVLALSHHGALAFPQATSQTSFRRKTTHLQASISKLSRPVLEAHSTLNSSNLITLLVYKFPPSSLVSASKHHSIVSNRHSEVNNRLTTLGDPHQLHQQTQQQRSQFVRQLACNSQHQHSSMLYQVTHNKQ